MTGITFKMTKYRTNRYENSQDECDNTTYRTINQSYRSLRYLLQPGHEKSTISRKREISYDILCAVYDIFGGQVPDDQMMNMNTTTVVKNYNSEKIR